MAPRKYCAIIETHIHLTRWNDPSGAPPSFVVWPESALPLLLGEQPDLRRRIGSVLPDAGYLLTGGLHRATSAGVQAPVYNALLAMTASGEITGRYDKVRLVPFGEFLPFAAVLEPLGLRQLANLPAGFTAGGSNGLIDAPNLATVAAYICYEAIFPWSYPRGVSPDLLVNVTNDAWFGTSSGPHQHLAHATMRAIEQGAFMVRAANTGISAVIDPAGQLIATLDLGKRGVLDIEIPNGKISTVYTHAGDFAFLLVLAILLVPPALSRTRATRLPPTQTDHDS